MTLLEVYTPPPPPPSQSHETLLVLYTSLRIAKINEDETCDNNLVKIFGIDFITLSLQYVHKFINPYCVTKMSIHHTPRKIKEKKSK